MNSGYSGRESDALVRARKDIVLCKRAREKKTRFYGKTKFTPEAVRRRDGLVKWQSAQTFWLRVLGTFLSPTHESIASPTLNHTQASAAVRQIPLIDLPDLFIIDLCEIPLVLARSRSPGCVDADIL